MNNIAEVAPLTGEMDMIHAELQRGLAEEAAKGASHEMLILNDDYYLQMAYRQGDLDKMRVFNKLLVAFRSEIHLVEAVIDIVRDDLGYSEAAPYIEAGTVETYRAAIDSFIGRAEIPAGAITRAAVAAVEASVQGSEVPVGSTGIRLI